MRRLERAHRIEGANGLWWQPLAELLGTRRVRHRYRLPHGVWLPGQGSAQLLKHACVRVDGRHLRATGGQR